jgi:hypothetical protein
MKPVEVVDISTDGFRLLVEERDFFLPFKDFPWFKKAKIADIHRVKILHGYHLHWPALDVDLELSALENLKNYPLIFR